MMFAISVQFRESIHDLQVQTTSVCRSMIGKQGNSGPQWKALLVDVIQDISNIVSGKTAADLAKWAIDKTLSLVKEQVKGEPVRGDDERAVLNGYLDAREELRASYNKNLDRIREWVDGRREEFEGLKLMLREPLKKSITDVDSPDFSYEHFHYADHDDPSVYAREVESERQKYVDEKPKPGGLISQRLDGEE